MTGNSMSLNDIELQKVSDLLAPKEWKRLGRYLEVDDLEKIQFDYSQYGIEEMGFQMLKKWQTSSPSEITKERLIDALTDIDRLDIANKLWSGLVKSKIANGSLSKSSRSNTVRTLTSLLCCLSSSRSIRANQQQIRDEQRRMCRAVELPQAPWTKKILPLEKLYVDLEMFKTIGDREENEGQPMALEDLFNKVDGKDPLRILIEGGPGFGKTTLCLKLLNDWGMKRSYISSKFKMVFMFQLRYCKESDSIEEMLKAECETIGVIGDDGISCIDVYENQTLLILDGFDELNEECKKKFLPLLQQKEYPSMSVVVTSRRGMFQVENQDDIHDMGIFKTISGDINKTHFWNIRVLIKGVTRNQLKFFMEKYLDMNYDTIESKINSMIRGEIDEVFQCPLFLLLFGIILEENTVENMTSKTSLYKEFFNFLIRSNLIREKLIESHDEINIFSESSRKSVETYIKILNQFGLLALKFLLENNLMFHENVILNHCNDRIILKLGFLIKIPKRHKHQRENFYQPIHKSFLEFLAAFAMWNLFNSNENQFRDNIEQIVSKGLKPTNDSLFYVFLGGLMKNKAYILFQTLIPFNLWFNMESICFTNILLEIENIESFYPSFEPMLELFVPPIYHLNDSLGVVNDFFPSHIHSLILKYANDRKLFHFLGWDTSLSFRLFDELFIDYLRMFVTNEVFQHLNQNQHKIKCKHIIYRFAEDFQKQNWDSFVLFSDSIKSEKFHFNFYKTAKEINSSIFELVHKELIDDRWTQKNIDRLRFHLNEFDKPNSISLLVDLVKKNRINGGVWLHIHKSQSRTKAELDLLKRETENLFKAIIKSTSVKEFYIRNDDYNFVPEFDFNEKHKIPLKSMYFGDAFTLVNSSNEKEVYPLEELTLFSLNNRNTANLIQAISSVKYLGCRLDCFNSLVEMQWSGLHEMEELFLYKMEVLNLNHIWQFANLNVLTLNVVDIKKVPSDCNRDSFENLFYCLDLKICELIFIQGMELFCFFADVLMDGLRKKKNENQNIFKLESARKIPLLELVMWFDNQIPIEFYHMKDCSGIKNIQLMLREQILQQFCWLDFDNHTIQRDHLLSLFPWNENFRISYELNGLSTDSSRRSKFSYRWFSMLDKFCVKLLKV